MDCGTDFYLIIKSPDVKSISKSFKFENFEAAFSFMNAVA